MQAKGKLAAERKTGRTGHMGRLRAMQNNGLGPNPEHMICKATEGSAEVRMRRDPDGSLVVVRGRSNVVLRLDHEASERLVDIAQHLIWGTPKTTGPAKARLAPGTPAKETNQ
jgi:hypothetical protein